MYFKTKYVNQADIFKQDEEQIVIGESGLLSIEDLLKKEDPIEDLMEKPYNQKQTRKSRKCPPRTIWKSHITDTLKRFRDSGIDVTQEYTVFQIPKASGGYRTIKAPSEQLMRYQVSVREILEQTLSMLPHNAAFAYVKQRSVYDAVYIHKENKSNWFLKVDLKKFFDRCTPELVIRQLEKQFPLVTLEKGNEDELMELITETAFLDGALPQGTPLSPTLTNQIMVAFDHSMTAMAYANKLRYTRYADDLLISSKYKFDYKKVIELIKQILIDEGYPELAINEDKTRYGSASGSNWNLGLMYNKDHEITIGHKTKRKLKFEMFMFVKNYERMSKDDALVLNGRLEWFRSNEPKAYEKVMEWFNRKHNVNLKRMIIDLLKSKE